MKKQLLTCLLATALVSTGEAIAQCDCGDGSDGVYHATANTTLAGGTYNYTTFTIDAGVTVTATGTQPLIIQCSGDVIINGIITVSGPDGTPGQTSVGPGLGAIAVAGGHNGGDGVFSASVGQVPGNNGYGPGFGGLGTLWGGGGGGGYGAIGTDGQMVGNGGGAGGAVYGNIYLTNTDGGSGGGGGSGGFNCGSGGGGAGGGIIVIHSCGTIVIAAGGAVMADGGDGGSDGTGNCGGGGGGAGGSIWLIADSMANNGSVSAIGGTGGTSTFTTPGGAGAVGRIRLDYNSISGSGTVTPAAGLVTSVFAANATFTDPLCNGDMNGTATSTAAGGGGFYSYSWTGGGTTAVINNLAAGTFIVTVTDTNGCTAIDTVVLTQPAVLTATMSNTLETNYGANDGTATATPAGGTSPYTYAWTPGGGTTATITGLDTGWYHVTITDDNGCTHVDSVHVGSALSVQNAGSAQGVSVYPNPASGVVNVSVMQSTGAVTVQLTDITGKLLKLESFKGNTSYPMDLGNYPPGTYLLRISSAEKVYNVPLSIK